MKTNICFFVGIMYSDEHCLGTTTVNNGTNVHLEREGSIDIVTTF